MTASRARTVGAAAVLAAALAAPAEGLRTVAYRDPVGIPTICFGATKGVKMGDVTTVEACKLRLTAEMQEAVEQVDRCQPGLPPKVLAAFADATYNMGPTIACDTGRSTAARLLASGQHRLACQQLPRWNKARVAGAAIALPGLTKRRQAEMDLCLEDAA